MSPSPRTLRTANVSVVIPALNEADNLTELLSALQSQSAPPGEIIVAADKCDDATRKVVGEFGGIIAPGGRPAFARNQGAAVSSGQLVAFWDADCRPPHAHFLDHAVVEMQRRGLCAAVTDVKPFFLPSDPGYRRRGLRRYYGLLMLLQSMGQRLCLKQGFPVGTAQFMIFRKAVFERLGRFRSDSEPFEDSEILLRCHRAVPPRGGEISSVGILSASLPILASMRRFDAMGPLWFPLRLSFQSVFLRYVLGRELPMPEYWDLNRKGFEHR